MKRIVFLAVGIVLLSALAASATVVTTVPVYENSSHTGPTIMDLTCTETPATGSAVSDKYVFTIKDFGTVGGAGFNTLGGTWTPATGSIYVATAAYQQDSAGDSPIVMPDAGDWFNDWTSTTTVGGHIATQSSESRTSFMGLDSTVEGTLNPATGNAVDYGGNPTFTRTGTWQQGLTDADANTYSAWMRHDVELPHRHLV